mgnify:CR=1 FL=1
MKIEELEKGTRVWCAYANINSSWEDKPVAIVSEYEIVEPTLKAAKGVSHSGGLLEMVHILHEAYPTQEAAWEACATKLAAKVASVEQKIAQCRRLAKGDVNVSCVD